MSTPTPNDKKRKATPQTMGWGHALFGTTWFSSKKARRVDSSTDSTTSKPKARPSPKPFENLEGFNSVHSPELLDKSNDDKGESTLSERPVYQSRASPYASVHETQPTAGPVSKSPWKPSSPGARFSVGTSYPGHSEAGTRTRSRNNAASASKSASMLASTGIVASDPSKRRRRRYRPSRILNPRRIAGKKSKPDMDLVNNILSDCRPAIEPSQQKIESDKNFTAAFKPGKRLKPMGEDFSRLPGRAASTKFITNGNHNIDVDQSRNNDSSKRKNKKVGFAENNSTRPLESIVLTPAKSGSSSQKRRATPFKPASGEKNIKNHDGTTSRACSPAKPANREYVRARRPTPSQTSNAKSEVSDAESEEVRPVKPSFKMVLGEPFTGWSSSPELEDSVADGSTAILRDDFMARYPPTDEGLATDKMAKGLPQFRQGPLYEGEKKDKTVRDDDDGSDTEGQDTSRPRTGENDTPKQEVQFSKGWGNTFAHLFKKDQIKCEKCLVMNDKNAKECVSCGADLTGMGEGEGASKENANTAPPTSGGQIGSQGFSFGKGPSDDKSPKNSFFNSSSGTAAAATATAAPASSTSTSFDLGGKTTTNSSAIGSNGFTFGSESKSKSPTTSTTAATKNSTIGSSGFQFGASVAKSSDLNATTTTPATTGGFQAASVEAKSTAETSLPKTSGFQFKPQAKSESPKPLQTGGVLQGPSSLNATAKPFSFGSSNIAAAPSQPAKPEASAAPTSSTGSNAGSQLFGNFASSSSSNQAPKFSFGSEKGMDSTSKPEVGQEAPKASTTETSQKRKGVGDSSKNSFVFPGSVPKNEDTRDAPVSFGVNSAATSTATSKTNPPAFTFGSASTAAPAASTNSNPAPKFSFGTNAGTPSVPPLGSVATEGNNGGGSKKKRRSGDDRSNGTSSSQPSGKLQGASFSGAPPAPAPTAAAPAAPFVFGKPSTNSTKEDKTSLNPPTFGNSSGTNSGASTTPAPSFASTAAPSFGSTPAPNFSSTPAPSFGSTPAPSFGSTPAPAPFTFGSTPAAAPAPAAPSAGGFQFGSVPVPAPAPASTTSAAPFNFGSSTPAPAPAAPTFGSTAPTQAAPIPFGSTPAPGPSSGFGSTPAPSSAMNFGSTTPAQPPAAFGSTPAAAPAAFGANPFLSSTPAAAPVAFGSTPAAPPQPFGNTPAPAFNNTATAFGNNQPNPAASPMPFGTTPSAQTGGFGASGFGQTSTQQTPANNAGFSMGSGPSRGTGRRRVVRARRPKR